AQPTDFVPWAAEDFPPDTPTTLLGATSPTPRQGAVLARKSSWVVDGIPFVSGGEAVFEGVVAYQTACQPGDSGGAGLMGGRRAVLGIHRAGSREAGVGLFQPIGPILGRHGLELVPASSTS